jgi:hypothetical protein
MTILEKPQEQGEIRHQEPAAVVSARLGARRRVALRLPGRLHRRSVSYHPLPRRAEAIPLRRLSFDRSRRVCNPQGLGTYVMLHAHLCMHTYTIASLLRASKQDVCDAMFMLRCYSFPCHAIYHVIELYMLYIYSYLFVK